MIKSSREKTITKQLWYLNKKEKTRLAQTLRHYDESEFIQNYKTNNQFVVSFLKQKVFNSKEKSQMHLLGALIGLFVSNVILLGLFILGLLLTLTSVKHLIDPTSSLNGAYVSMIMTTSIFATLVTLLLMKPVNAFFTKRLIDYKLNRMHK